MNWKWGCPMADHGQTIGFQGNGIDEFLDDPIGNLAREAIQNSLDARKDNLPVTVEFSLFKTSIERFPGLFQYSDYISNWQASQKKKKKSTKNSDEWSFYDGVLRYLHNPQCVMTWLRVSDHNTTGMAGSSNPSDEETPWYAFTKAFGQNEKSLDAGGSKGLGKNAFFACSQGRTIFVSTRSVYFNKTETASFGIAKLSSYQKADDTPYPDNTQGVLYCTWDDDDSQKYFLPANELLQLDPNYLRQPDDLGSDVYIPMFNNSNGWEKAILQEAIISFLPAFLEGKLRVIVSGENQRTEISKATIGKEVKNKDNYISGSSKRSDRAKAFYEVLTSKETIVKKYKDKPGFEMTLFALPNRISPTNSVEIYRMPTQMKILERTPEYDEPYSGVLYLEGSEICQRLKAVENATHSRWSINKHSATRFKREEIEEALGTLQSFMVKSLSSLDVRNNQGAVDFDYAKSQGWSSDDSTEGLDERDIKEEGLPTPISQFSDSQDEVRHRTLQKPRKRKADVEDENGDAESLLPGYGQVEPNGTEVGSFPTGHNEGSGGEDHPGSDETNIGEGDKPMMVRKRVDTIACRMPAIDPRNGKFCLVFTPQKSGSDAEIEIQALGVDDSDEFTPVLKAQMNGQDLAIVDGKIALSQIERGQTYQIEVQVDAKLNYIWEVNVSANE